MSTTVTYKGATIATVNNNIKTLKTAGKYMEGDVVLTDIAGVGGITQDENGYLVLDDNAPSFNVLEYETGTFIPTTDTASYNIFFSRTHTTLPFLTMVMPLSDEYDATLNTANITTYLNWYTMFEWISRASSTGKTYGETRWRYRGTSTSGFSTGGITISYPDSNTGTSSNTYPRFWATESGMKAYSGSNSAYFKAGTTYRWFAAWPPSI